MAAAPGTLLPKPATTHAAFVSFMPELTENVSAGISNHRPPAPKASERAQFLVDKTHILKALWAIVYSVSRAL